ncbi:flagellar hook-basal body complex protein [Sulfurimonas sp.]|jgi:flagellar hook protein FlgE|uniref:flagellar hook-basal body complex protein n=1 Tax=Sulfurimonas sp. TaxID=2022749 RepID=UPI002600ED27|nr:flagellar hook-basal body complex protein [Sulfurimonas sp.]MBT5935759.1 flagellar hook protein FlgE [Sulfurimonas sp.]
MMSQAFYTGLSGLRSNAQAIDVVTDNLSNVSTVGYRGYTTEFSSMYQKAINTDASITSVANGIGVGSEVGGVVMDQAQGVFQLTDSATDLAILGDGWFGVEGNGQTMYTRDGSFTFDENRDLVTQDGFFVLGTMGNNIANNVLTEPLSEIALANVSEQEKLSFPTELYFPPIASTEVTFLGNLSLTEEQIKQDTAALADIAANALDPNHKITLPRAALSVSSTVINADGVKNNLRLEFSKVDPQVAPGSQWNVKATVQSRDGAEVFSTENGLVTFEELGALTSNSLNTIDNQGSPVAINMGVGFDGIISIDTDSTLSSSSDGEEDGTLVGYEIEKNGSVLATFTNGKQSAVGSIGIFHFQNDQGLERVSGSKFSESANSGKAIFFQDENGNNINGTGLVTSKLEGSNVRMEAGLTDLIIYQRAYDSSSKLITTADEMLQKALSMGA